VGLEVLKNDYAVVASAARAVLLIPRTPAGEALVLAVKAYGAVDERCLPPSYERVRLQYGGLSQPHACCPRAITPYLFSDPGAYAPSHHVNPQSSGLNLRWRAGRGRIWQTW